MHFKRAIYEKNIYEYKRLSTSQKFVNFEEV